MERKGEKENFGVKARHGKAKKRFLVLKRGAERQKRNFWCLSATRKGEKEIFGVKAWRGKAKKRF